MCRENEGAALGDAQWDGHLAGGGFCDRGRRLPSGEIVAADAELGSVTSGASQG